MLYPWRCMRQYGLLTGFSLFATSFCLSVRSALWLGMLGTLPSQVSYVESNQRYGIIEAVIHLVNRDFVALADLYKRLGFIPQEQVSHASDFSGFLFFSFRMGPHITCL